MRKLLFLLLFISFTFFVSFYFLNIQPVDNLDQDENIDQDCFVSIKPIWFGESSINNTIIADEKYMTIFLDTNCSNATLSYSFFHSFPKNDIYVFLKDNDSFKKDFKEQIQVKRDYTIGLPTDLDNKTILIYDDYISESIFLSFLENNKNFDILYFGKDTQFTTQKDYAIHRNKSLMDRMLNAGCIQRGFNTFVCNDNYFMFFDSKRNFFQEAFFSRRYSCFNFLKDLKISQGGYFDLREDSSCDASYVLISFESFDFYFEELFKFNQTFVGRIDLLNNDTISTTLLCDRGCNSGLFLNYVTKNENEKVSFGDCDEGICRKAYELNLSKVLEQNGYLEISDVFDRVFARRAFNKKRMDINFIEKKDRTYFFEIRIDKELQRQGIIDIFIFNESISKSINNNGVFSVIASPSLRGDIPLDFKFQEMTVTKNIFFDHKGFFDRYVELFFPLIFSFIIIFMLFNKPKKRKYTILIPEMAKEKWPEITIKKEEIKQAIKEKYQKMNWIGVALLLKEIQSQLCIGVSKRIGKNILFSVEDLEIILSQLDFLVIKQGYCILKEDLTDKMDVNYFILKRNLIDTLVSNGLRFKLKEDGSLLVLDKYNVVPFFKGCEEISLKKNLKNIIIFKNKSNLNFYLNSIKDSTKIDLIKYISFEKIKLYTLDDIKFKIKR